MNDARQKFRPQPKPFKFLIKYLSVVETFYIFAVFLYACWWGNDKAWVCPFGINSRQLQKVVVSLDAHRLLWQKLPEIIYNYCEVCLVGVDLSSWL